MGNPIVRSQVELKPESLASWLWGLDRVGAAYTFTAVREGNGGVKLELQIDGNDPHEVALELAGDGTWTMSMHVPIGEQA